MGGLGEKYRGKAGARCSNRFNNECRVKAERVKATETSPSVWKTLGNITAKCTTPSAVFYKPKLPAKARILYLRRVTPKASTPSKFTKSKTSAKKLLKS